MTEHHDVVIVGAGQAGLSLSHHLTQAGVEHVLLEKDTVAHDWRDRRWDNFTLVTPNWQCQLPGYPYSGDDPDGFMTRDQVYRWLRDYAETIAAPVREGVAVTSVTVDHEAGFRLETTTGALTATSVVIATGGYHEPVLPRMAETFPAGIRQVHSADYRNAGDLPPGDVLVVGSGQSGAQIAEDLMLEGRRVHLALGSAPRVARFYRGRDCVAWLHDMGVYDISVQQHAGGLAKRESTNHVVTGRDGGRDIDFRRFARDGMALYGRLTGVDGTRATFAPTLRASLDAADAVAESIKDDIDAYIARAGIAAPGEERPVPVWEPTSEPEALDLTTVGSVVWAVGFRHDYRWVRIGAFDGAGHPVHARGTSPVDGLFFLGLPWLHTWGSGRFAAIARDAEHLARQIVGERTPARALATVS